MVEQADKGGAVVVMEKRCYEVRRKVVKLVKNDSTYEDVAEGGEEEDKKTGGGGRQEERLWKVT